MNTYKRNINEKKNKSNEKDKKTGKKRETKKRVKISKGKPSDEKKKIEYVDEVKWVKKSISYTKTKRK